MSKVMDEKEIEEFIKSNRYGVLALTDNTRPYAIPVEYYYENGTVFFAFLPSGRKFDYIRKNNSVCLTIYKMEEGPAPRPYKSAILEGNVSQVKDEKEIDLAIQIVEKGFNLPEGSLRERMKKYFSDPSKSLIFKMDVLSISGKKRLEDGYTTKPFTFKPIRK